MRLRSRPIAACAVLLIGIFLPWLLPGYGAAQEPDWNRLDDPLYEAVGLHAGQIGGAGLSYKFPVKWWLYAQVTGGIWHTSGDKRHNVGLMAQYVLRQAGRHRLYAAAGVGHFYHRQDGRTRDHVNTGFGLGLEHLRWERASIQLELDFTHQGDDGDIVLFPQLGLYFYF